MPIARQHPPSVARRVLLPLVVLGGALPAALGAQSAEPATVGATVRLLGPPPDGWRQGRLVAFDSTRVVIRGRYQGDPNHVVAVAALRQLEVRHHPARAARAVGYGAVGGVLGAVFGGLAGAVLTQCNGCDSPGLGALLGVPLGGAVGVVVGAVTGANTGGRWVPARLPYWDPARRPTPAASAAPAPPAGASPEPPRHGARLGLMVV